MTSEIIKPNSKLPHFNSTSLLIVGAEGTGKHELAKALLSVNQSGPVHVRTVSSLPLSQEHADSRPRIDFICFLIDLTNRESMRTVEEAVKYVDTRYFLGKVCFAALKVKCPEKRGIDLDLLTSFCDHYQSPVLFGGLEDDQEKINLAKQVLNMAKVSAGLIHNISPLLLDSTRKPYDTLSM